jgi:hypothetical protein
MAQPSAVETAFLGAIQSEGAEELMSGVAAVLKAKANEMAQYGALEIVTSLANDPANVAAVREAATAGASFLRSLFGKQE